MPRRPGRRGDDRVPQLSGNLIAASGKNDLHPDDVGIPASVVPGQVSRVAADHVFSLAWQPAGERWAWTVADSYRVDDRGTIPCGEGHDEVFLEPPLTADSAVEVMHSLDRPGLRGSTGGR